MLTLVVKRHGKELSRLSLEPGQEYIAGRAQNCTIVLDNEQKFSRHHFKILQSEDGAWMVERLSRFGTLLYEEEEVGQITLNEGTAFSVPPYDFVIEAEAEQEDVSEEKAESGNALVVTPEKESPAQPPSEEEGNLEATTIQSPQLAPFLKVSNNGNPSELIELEGDVWVGGRDSDCDIPIENSHASRRHFEIRRTKDGFYIKDLESANGTTVNGEALVANEPVRINSGDRIEIISITLDFEIHDPLFQQKVQNVDEKALQLQKSPPLQQTGAPEAPTIVGAHPLPPPEEEEEPSFSLADLKEFRLEDLKNIDFKRHKVKIAIFALIPFLLLGLLEGGSKQAQEQGKASTSSKSPPLRKLSKEKKQAVSDMFDLAKKLYQQKKYELCLSEIEKIHEILPQYKDSRELKDLCKQGSYLMRRKEQRAREEKQKRQTEQKIADTVEKCRAELKNKPTVKEAEECLAPAIQLSPQHPKIQELIDSVQLKQEKRKRKAQRRRERQRRARMGRQQLKKAARLHEQGHLRRAITEYGKYLQADFPNPESTENKARRQLASARQQLEEKVDELLESCRDRLQSEKFKKAYTKCNEAATEDPKNKKVQRLKRKVKARLTKKMKSLYQDAALEESLGEVQSAKKKWKKIIEKDIEGGKYYKKAEQKLKQYGIEAL